MRCFLKLAHNELAYHEKNWSNLAKFSKTCFHAKKKVVQFLNANSENIKCFNNEPEKLNKSTT